MCRNRALVASPTSHHPRRPRRRHASWPPGNSSAAASSSLPGRPAPRSPRPPGPESPERPPGPALPAAASLRGSAASGLAAPAATKMRFEGCTKETRHPGCNQAEGAEPSTPARQNPEAELFLGLSVGFESTATRSASGQGCKVRGLQPCCTKSFSKSRIVSCQLPQSMQSWRRITEMTIPMLNPDPKRSNLSRHGASSMRSCFTLISPGPGRKPMLLRLLDTIRTREQPLLSPSTLAASSQAQRSWRARHAGWPPRC